MARDSGADREDATASLVATIRAAAEEVVAREDAVPVVALYLYGSAARGRVTPLSDLDLAALFPSHVSEERRWRELPRLGSAVARRLAHRATETPAVDVHDLSSLPIAVQGRVLTEGILVLSLDEGRRVRFEDRTRRRYFDFLPFQEADTEEGLEGLRERTGRG